jgi:hypothetical protein
MAGAGDAVAIAAIYRPYVTEAVISFEVEAPSAAEMARRIEAVLSFAPLVGQPGRRGPADRLRLCLAARRARRLSVVGRHDGLHPRGAPAARRGTGALSVAPPAVAAARFLCRARGDRAAQRRQRGAPRIIRLSCGGRLPGRRLEVRARRDVGWWHLPLQQRPATPAPPLSLAEAQRLPAWPAALSPVPGVT